MILSDGDDIDAVIDSPVVAAMLPLLDGTRSFERIAVAIAERGSLAEIAAAIRWLEERGFVAYGELDGDAAAAAFWEASGVDAAEARRRLATASVATVAVGDVSLDEVERSLAALGIRVADEAPLTCVLTDDYLRPELEELNREFVRSQSAWLIARPLGRELWLGPLFRPPETGCWRCLAERLRRFPGTAAVARSPSLAARPSLPTTTSTAAALLATHVASFVASGRAEALDGNLVTVNVATLESRRHVLVRDPSCSVCGTPVPVTPQRPITLQPTKTREGYRTRSAAETLERLAPEVSPLSGIVRTLTRVPTTLDDVVHVWLSDHELARGRRLTIADFRSFAAGKGRSDIDARTGAVCEAIERHCGCFREELPRSRGTLHDRGEAAVAPQQLLLYSERQKDAPPPFDADRPIDWTRVWSLTHERPRELPSAYCWYGFPDGDFCPADSNGCAAGATLEEAILHGVLELVERDSVALWWYTRGRVPGVELDSFADPYVDVLRERFEAIGRELWALDLTTDLGLPSFVALSRRIAEAPERIVFGFGAHLDPRVALTRALTEHNQVFAIVEAFPDVVGGELRAWLDEAAVATEPWLRPRDAAPPRRLDEFPALAGGNLALDVRTCVDRLAAARLETLVLDQSRREIDLRVVRVTVPGLRHFWRRLAPGRLYDVPPQLGWVDAVPRERDLNPWSVFL